MSRRLVAILAVAAGVAVANLYYAQPLLPMIASTWGLSARAVASMVTFAQMGYAVGLLLVVPLGDKFERRGLILTMLGLVSVALLAVAVAMTPAWLMMASFAVGVTTITPQLVVPFAAHLAGPQRRGRVVGTVMSGLLVGILVARTMSGALGAWLGWRAVYVVAAGLMVALAALLARELPRSEPATPDLNYIDLLRSLGRLIREEPILRSSSFYGAMSFAAFSAFWNVLPFLLSGAPYHYGTAVIGLFGLIGATGITVAPLAGRMADRGHAVAVIGAGLAISLAGYALLWAFPYHLAALITGILIIDFGITANQISNQWRIYSIRPEARNRINTVYMVSYFVAGSIGSFLGAWGWTAAGWSGYCYVAAGFIAIALGVFAINSRT
jgi:predicted MFS family arabinose efflux permease